MSAAAKPLPEVRVGGSVRTLNPRSNARMADGSIRIQCVGGPYDRKEVRLYPPYDEPFDVLDGY